MRNDRPTIRVTTIEDLLALVPFLLGFQPELSLVLIALNDDGVPFTARLTLPTPGQPSTALRAAWTMVTARLAPRDGVRVVLVGYGPADQVQAAAGTATEVLQQAGIAISAVLRVADGRLWHLDRPGTADGFSFDATASPAAAAAVYAGLVALPDRDALAATLNPVTGPARERMVTATAAACGFLVDLLDAGPDTSMSGASGGDPATVLNSPLGLALQHAARTYFTQAQDSYRAGWPVDDDHAATLTVLLALPSLRDHAAQSASREPWQQDMWADLVRRAEPPFTAGPAVLLALCALLSGDGALASIAVSRALDTNPGDRLAQLLAGAIAAGIDPDTVAALLAP